jgi:hypothetical protein
VQSFSSQSPVGLMTKFTLSVFKVASCCVYSIKLLLKLFLSHHNNNEKSHTLHCAIMSVLVLRYYIALRVSAPKSIIRRYNLTNIFKLLSCAPYMVSYNLNAY